MPANIDSMAYYGETPWHGLAVLLSAPPDSATMIKAAGLDWKVEMPPAPGARLALGLPTTSRFGLRDVVSHVIPLECAGRPRYQCRCRGVAVTARCLVRAAAPVASRQVQHCGVGATGPGVRGGPAPSCQRTRPQASGGDWACRLPVQRRTPAGDLLLVASDVDGPA